MRQLLEVWSWRDLLMLFPLLVLGYLLMTDEITEGHAALVIALGQYGYHWSRVPRRLP